MTILFEEWKEYDRLSSENKIVIPDAVLEKTNEIYIYNCRPTTKLRKTAWPSSEVIKEFDQFINSNILSQLGTFKLFPPLGLM